MADLVRLRSDLQVVADYVREQQASGAALEQLIKSQHKCFTERVSNIDEVPMAEATQLTPLFNQCPVF